MALAKNINRHKVNTKSLKFSKSAWIGFLLILAILLYGTFNISRIIPEKEKKEIRFETGDQPLPQTINLWVVADGGLRLRAKPDANSDLLSLIPNGTQLVATETQGDWYRVSYQNKEGWVSKKYVTTQPPAEDPMKNWKSFVNKEQGYSVRYPSSWVAQDYGPNPATNSLSYVGFGLQLGPTLDPSVLPPIIVRISSSSKDQIEAYYKSSQNVVAESVNVSGLAATKYTYNAPSGVQMTAFVIPQSSRIFIIEETGGYAEELMLLVKSLVLG